MLTHHFFRQRIFDARHAKARTRWSVPDSFPNKQVAEAYVKPMVIVPLYVAVFACYLSYCNRI